MHTFFINTSEKELENYDGFFEVQHETRQLVSLECPMSKWQDKNAGYEACVDKMGEMIDSYKDITNEFNLIIYVDLLPYKDYTSISMDKHLERSSCLAAMHAMLKHHICATMVKRLNDYGREPKQVLIIFEENPLPKDSDNGSDDGKNRIYRYIKKLLRWEDREESIGKLIESLPEKSLTAKDFCDMLERECQAKPEEYKAPVFDGILYTYLNHIDVMLIDSKKKTIQTIINNLCKRILEGYSDDDEVETVIFQTNRRVDVENKQANARRELRLCFYLYSCVEDQTIYEVRNIDPYSDDENRVKQFYDINWDKVGLLMNEKTATYKQKKREISNIKETFSKLGLAPELYSLDKKRFALDEFGKHENESDSRESLLDEYKDFDSLGDKLSPSKSAQKNTFSVGDVSINTTADEFLSKAKKLRDHHLNFVYKVDNHVSDRLSNYAGRSRENELAILQRRKVNLDDEIFEDELDYQYAASNADGKKDPEEQQLNVVEDVSKRAYSTSVLDYMEFCAGRNVALTDIEEQYNWFEERVEQIKESLKKIKFAAIGMLFAILILYVPFFLVQFESIFDNTMTLTIAIISIAIPIALLYVVFGFISFLQKKKFYSVWKEFKKKSDKALAANKEAIKKYDELLNTYIPSLRYIYEYKLDVEFYADCCRLARAKVEHHSNKLTAMLQIIDNIVEDLEIETDIDDEEIRGRKNAVLEYQFSFCSGEKNRRFYSVIDHQFLEAVYIKEGRQ